MTSLKTLNRMIGKCYEDQVKRDVSLTRNINKFNNELYKLVTCHAQGSFTMSGLSVHLALSMCSLGARNSTAEEMYKALHLDESIRLTNIKNIISHLHEVADITLSIANRIYIDKKIVVKKAFKSDMKSIFLSDIKNKDFESEKQKTVNNINQWCSRQTNDKIKNIISTGDITATTALIVLNAVYFKAHWQDKFNVCSTRAVPFHISKTETIMIPTMHRAGSFMYKHLTAFNAECVAIPYKNPDFLFVLIKPNEIDGLRYLEENIDKIDLNYEYFEVEKIYLSLPKFKVQTTVNLKEYLEKLGMVQMFTEEANFKGISEEPVVCPPLHVDNILQKAFVEVDEAGTKAAAATCPRILLGTSQCSSMQWREFKVDKPFIYRIVNMSCNLTLFNGRIIRPIYN